MDCPVIFWFPVSSDFNTEHEVDIDLLFYLVAIVY